MVWDCGYLKIGCIGEFFGYAILFTLRTNARNEEPYIMISMDDVALNGFRHLYLRLGNDGKIIFGIRNKRGEWIGGRGGALS